MATIIPAHGRPYNVTPMHGDAFTLAELQNLVGGYLEVVRSPDGRIAFLNEDGKRLQLPRNVHATDLLRAALRPDDVIVGNVVLCTLVEAGESGEPES